MAQRHARSGTHWPAHVCVLDIETRTIARTRPEEAELAFVGVQVWTRRGTRYMPGPYQWFEPNQLTELERFLKAFPGPIVGHNLFDFDYRVLRRHIHLDGVIEKTVDTLYFLFRRNGGTFRGTGLDALARLHFGEGKTLSGRSIPELWRAGQRDEVLAYNAVDLRLTQRLWETFAKAKTITTADPSVVAPPIRVNQSDLGELLGVRSTLTYAAWAEKLDREGFVTLQRRQWIRWSALDDYGGELPTESAYYWFDCASCQQTALFEATIVRGFADFETVSCPTCRSPFGEVRADMGVALVGSVPGLFGRGMAQGRVPEPFIGVVRAHMDRTREIWAATRRELDGCQTCGQRWLGYPDEKWENPIDGSPICASCLTAGRWLFATK